MWRDRLSLQKKLLLAYNKTLGSRKKFGHISCHMETSLATAFWNCYSQHAVHPHRHRPHLLDPGKRQAAITAEICEISAAANAIESADAKGAAGPGLGVMDNEERSLWDHLVGILMQNYGSVNLMQNPEDS